MLVMELRINDGRILIFPPDGSCISVKLLKTRGSIARVGIKAPKKYSIIRDKVLDRKNEERRFST